MSFPPCPDRRGFASAHLLLFLLFCAWTVASAAPLTAVEEGKMTGKWIVNSGNRGTIQRLYEITAGRNIRVEGGNLDDRRGRLNLQADGAFALKLDEGLIRLTYTPANDELIVEYYQGKKDLELGLKPKWRTKAIRKKD